MQNMYYFINDICRIIPASWEIVNCLALCILYNSITVLVDVVCAMGKVWGCLPMPAAYVTAADA